MFANDGNVADFAVALAELVMCETDGAGVVSRLGLLEGAAMKRNRPGLIPSRGREPTVKTPERRELTGRDSIAECIRRTTECRRSLIEVVLKQPGLGERRADRQLVVAGQGRRTECRRQQLRGLGAATALERRTGSSDERLDGGGRHG